MTDLEIIKLTETQLANRVGWVRDLLSGRFNQGRRYLKKKNEDGKFSYCCLGVACERVAPRAISLRMTSYGSSEGYFSKQVERRLGFVDRDQNTAGSWNDSKKLSFARIADLVAYATEHRIPFVRVHQPYVPNGYAAEWLQNFSVR